MCTLFYVSWASKSLINFQIFFPFISNLLIKKNVLKSFSYFERCPGTIHDEIQFGYRVEMIWWVFHLKQLVWNFCQFSA